ncbi:MAG: 8-oxo-dGTP diphosphatase [Patescibacteria group bacterium]
MKIIMTLCLIHKDDQLLLGMKKRDFGKDRWNGFGGKLHQGENIEQALFREMKEEAGIKPVKPEKRAIMHFTTEENDDEIEVHLFCANNIIGEPKESDEMKPQWFAVDKLPFEQMWPDDRLWMPYFLAGKKFRASFHFQNNNKVIYHKIEEVKEI